MEPLNSNSPEFTPKIAKLNVASPSFTPSNLPSEGNELNVESPSFIPGIVSVDPPYANEPTLNANSRIFVQSPNNLDSPSLAPDYAYPFQQLALNPNNSVLNPENLKTAAAESLNVNSPVFVPDMKPKFQSEAMVYSVISVMIPFFHLFILSFGFRFCFWFWVLG
jgi:hypothetical protein